MRRLTLFACVLVAGCGDDSGKPDGGVQLPLVTISGHVVAAPGAPVPVSDVTVSVVDPVQDVSVQTDDKGAFQLLGVSTNSDGKVRIYVNGITGGGGPYITADKILLTDPVNQPAVDAGTIRLAKMDTNSIVKLDSTIADITAAAGGGPQKVTLKVDVTLQSGPVNLGAGGFATAQSRVPAGTQLTFPSAAPLILNLTRLDPSAIPAPQPKASDGPRYTGYFVTLQPVGVTVPAPGITMQIPEIDGANVGDPIEFWQADNSAQSFLKLAMGSVQTIPGFGPFAVPDGPFITEFQFNAATPTCMVSKTTVEGTVVDAAGQPVAGADIIVTGGFHGTAGMDGTFSIVDVALGCGANAITSLDVSASRLRGDGTLITGQVSAVTPVPDMKTEVGMITLSSPLYVVRSSPDNAVGVSTDTEFDVFFSDPVDPTTINPGVKITSLGGGTIRTSGSPCTTFESPITGTAYLDSADPTHVRFVPASTLQEGHQYFGVVDSTVLKSAAGNSMPADYHTPFTTIDHQPPFASINFPSPNNAIAFVSGGNIGASGQASDPSGIASVRWQVFTDGGKGTTGPQIGGDIGSTLATDACNGNKQVTATAQIPVPQDPANYILRMIARDTSGNESQNDTQFTVVAAGQAFPFCGSAVTTAYVSSNGYITFDGPDTTYDPSVEEFFMHPRVSAAYTDIDFRNQANGNVVWNVVPGADPGFAVTWLNAGLYSGLAGPDTFQIVLFQSGAIQISFGAMSDTIASTSGSQLEDFFMGVSCPGTPLSPPPPPTTLLTPQPQPDTTNDVQNIMNWTNQPVYDFLQRQAPSGPPFPHALFDSRYYNFVPPGQTPKDYVPIFQTGTAIPNILCDDCAVAVPITFQAQPVTDGGVPPMDSGVVGIPDAGIGQSMTVDLSGPWTQFNKLNQTGSPQVSVSNVFCDSVTENAVGTGVSACTCNAMRMIRTLNASYPCATTQLQIDYNSTINGTGTLNNQGLKINFVNSLGGTVGFFEGSMQTGTSNCADHWGNQWPQVPQLQQGLNSKALNTLQPTVNGQCAGSFDTLDIQLEAYICADNTNTSSATVNGITVLNSPGTN